MKKLAVIIIAMASVLALLSVYYLVFSQDALERKMSNTDDMIEFQKCCSRMKDQTVLLRFVLEGETWGKRRTALDYITEPALLEKVIAESMDADSFDVGFAAAARLEHIKSGRPASELEPTVQWYEFSADGKVAN